MKVLSLPGSLAIVILLMVFLTSSHLMAQNSEKASSYRLSIEGAEQAKVGIEWTFTLEDSLLFMAHGATQFPKRWSKFVENVSAENGDGKPIKIEFLPDAQWKVHSAEGTIITLRYDVVIMHEEHEWSGGIDGIAYVKPWGMLCSGRSLFIMNGEDKACEVEFKVPSHWKVSSSWPESKKEQTFRVQNHTSLTNAMFFAGEHEEVIVQRDEFELIFALGGPEIIAQKEEFSGLAEGVLDYYIDLFGDIPNPPPGQELKKAVVIMNTAESTDGEVVGNDISILLEADGDAMSQMISRFIFAHEFFHLWNGKSFIPDQDNVEWFKEGFTNYYTLKSLHHVGVLDQKSFFDVLASFFYARYSGDNGVGNLSMTHGSAKHDHWGLIYAGGLFVSIMQDIQIRQATNNKKSIDDLMKFLFTKYGGTDGRYDMAELQEVMTELNGKSQNAFFEQYVVGTKSLPLAEFLRGIGLKAQLSEGQMTIEVPEDITETQKKIIAGILGM